VTLARHTPPGIRPPFANYCFGVEIPPGARILVCSGQLGITLDDVIPAGAEAQAALCFEAIGKVLASAGMGFDDLVRLNAYVTGREHLKAYMTVRDRYVASPPPASTLMMVSGFANEAFHVEVEAIAAKVDR
jgi:enamine deaminase RidA (YjgF/YER057c/UK114 family)